MSAEELDLDAILAFAIKLARDVSGPFEGVRSVIALFQAYHFGIFRILASRHCIDLVLKALWTESLGN